MACPLLNQCKKVGMDCSERNFANCNFYKEILREKEALRMQKLVESYNLPEKIEAQKEYYRKKFRENYKSKRLEEKQVEREAYRQKEEALKNE
jgi:adenylosuccinate synthase